MTKKLQKIDVCLVVNTLTQANPVFDISKSLLRQKKIDNIGILVWFNAEYNIFNNVVDLDNFRENESIYIKELGSDGILGLEMDSFRKAREFISNYDIVQTHPSPSDTYGKLLSYYLNKPVIYRDGTLRNRRSLSSRIPTAISNLFADSIVCISHEVCNSSSRFEDLIVGSGNKHIIYNGVDIDFIEKQKNAGWNLREEYEIDENSLIISNVGKFHYSKDQDTLLKGINKANKYFDEDIQLIIAGGGDRERELKNITEELDIGERVHFTGVVQRKRVYQILHQSDIYVMPSRWEGFCTAVLQAMATQTPCLLSDIDVFKEVYQDAPMYFEVDNVTSLVDNLGIYIKSEDERYKHSNMGYRLANEKYNINRMGERYCELYEKIISTNGEL